MLLAIRQKRRPVRSWKPSPFRSVRVTADDEQDERAGAKVFAVQAAEWERRPIGFGELRVGNIVLDLGRAGHACCA
jgi:hypothetical protein